MIQEARYYSGLIRGVYKFLRAAPQDPVGALNEQMAQRQARFLDCTLRIVFVDRHHPFNTMFRLAGCEFGDLASAVTRDGLEPTLEKLLAAGVYLTHDEFKGRTPIVRSGIEIPSTPASFLNPLVPGYFETSSSGSSGVRTPARQSTELKLYRLVYGVLETRDLGLDRLCRCQVSPVLPSSIGFNRPLHLSRCGQVVDRWFAPRNSGRGAARYRLMTHALVQFSRALGAPLPRPELLPDNDFAPVARWLARQKQQGRRSSVSAFVSPAARVAAAAAAANLDISGTLFLVGGEALTSAKRAVIESAGCEVFPRYHINEVGYIGTACRRMRTGNCVHLFRDALAVITRRRRARLSDLEVDSILFTTLLPFETRFLINTEMDDAGVVEPVACDCEFAALGMNWQVRDIFSYGKLTGQGITLLGGDALRVLEVALPARFGGAAGDYQLVEEEGARQTELTLRVSPRVGAVAPAAVAEFFLDEIRRYYGGSLAASVWRHSGGLHVAIEEPSAGGSGKVLPLHTLRSRTTQPHVA